MLQSLLLFTLATVSSAHFVINYPPDRGNSYNTQFQFPCGGMKPGNRSAWPTNGGAISIVPLHDSALTTINIVIGNDIPDDTGANRYNHVMKATFNQTGGNGTFCLPQVKIPGSYKPLAKAGVNATIQIVQLVASGAALYNCADITFSDTEANRFGKPEIWDKTCFNSSWIGANYITNGDKVVNYTELALKELQLKEAAGSHVTIALPVLASSILVSAWALWGGLW